MGFEDFPEGLKRELEVFITAKGRLKSKFLPAVFCDTSFLLDYWNSSIYEARFKNLPWNQTNKTDQLFINYLKSDKKLQQVFQIREIVESFKNNCSLVFTPACRLELEEVITSARFRNNGVTIADINFILKKGRKEIGDILKKIYDDFHSDPQNSDLKNIFWDHFYTTNRIDEELYRFIEPDIKNFTLDKKLFFEIGILANLQIGFADIFHLISAHNLGCKYFFTFDNDFLRGKQIISEYLQVEIITDIEEIKRIILEGDF